GRRVMRSMGGAGDVVDEPRLIGTERVDTTQVRNGVVGLPGDQVPARVADVWVNRRGVAKEIRLPLVRVASDEAVEVLEAHADRPLIERSVLARLEGRRVVVLAEPGRAVSIVLQDAADRRLVTGDDAVIAGIAGCLFGDHTETARMVVAPGDESRPRR